jgi:hypothetical protein
MRIYLQFRSIAPARPALGLDFSAFGVFGGQTLSW